MTRLDRFVILCAAALSPAMVGQSAAAQQPAPANSAYRKLAPGVVEDVYPDRRLDESVARHDAIELLAVDENFDWAKEVPFRHDVWTLDFRFKPVRLLWVDVPGPKGQMQRKLVWYMVYSVTNPGKTMHPVEQPDGTYKVEFVDRAVRFLPVFRLATHTRMRDGDDDPSTKVYTDHLIPVAASAVAEREDPHRRFFNSVEIGGGEIAVGKTAWGIVVWEDVDPRTKWFSVYVEGLTNAYRWDDGKGAFTEKDFGKESKIGKGRRPWRKVLKLNFWRPSDEYFEHEREIRYGVPGRVDYEWVYR